MRLGVLRVLLWLGTAASSALLHIYHCAHGRRLELTWWFRWRQEGSQSLQGEYGFMSSNQQSLTIGRRDAPNATPLKRVQETRLVQTYMAYSAVKQAKLKAFLTPTQTRPRVLPGVRILWYVTRLDLLSSLTSSSLSTSKTLRNTFPEPRWLLGVWRRAKTGTTWSRTLVAWEHEAWNWQAQTLTERYQMNNSYGFSSSFESVDASLQTNRFHPRFCTMTHRLGLEKEIQICIGSVAWGWRSRWSSNAQHGVLNFVVSINLIETRTSLLSLWTLRFHFPCFID